MLGALSALAPLSIDASLPALPAMVKALGTTDAAIQATLGTFMLAFAIGQLASGPLSDRYGRRPVIVVGLGLYALSGLACAFATSAALLIAARFVQGLGACAGSVVGRAMIRDVFTDRTRSASMQAYVNAVFGIAPVVAPLLGAALLPLGWRAIYAALALLGASLLAVTLATLPETLPARERSTASVTRAYRDFLRLPRSIALAALVASLFAAHFSFISGSPFVLQQQLHLGSTIYALAFSSTACALLVGSVLAARLVHRVGPERLLAGGSCLAAAVGVLSLALDTLNPPTVGGFVFTMGAFAFAFGLTVPIVFATALEEAGAMAGVGAAVLGAAQMVGGALGSSVVGALAAPPAAAVGAIVLVAGACSAGAYFASRPARARTA